MRQCVQLDYDLPRGWRANASTCTARDVEAELVRSHVRAFGGALVGDLRGWAHGKARSTQWVHNWVGKFEPPADGFDGGARGGADHRRARAGGYG